jgi:hypothetical protein
MGTNYVHPLLMRSRDIESMVPYWDKVDDVVEGQHAIKSEGKKYLPMFPDETKDEYDFRLSLSKFTNIYRDVLEGLAQKPFEEELSLIGGEKIPDELIQFIEDVDGSGNNITVFSSLTFFNGINNAIDWIMIDYPTSDLNIRTVADAKNANIRPFWSHVLAKNVLEIRTTIIGAKEVLSYFRMLEPSTTITGADRVRVFERFVNTVVWTLYEKVENPDKPENQFIKVDEGTLSIDVIPFVPFITGRRDGKSFKFLPVMRDAADLQITLYQNESALEFIKTMAGYPMLAANGIKPIKDATGKITERVAVGPMKVLYGVPDGSGGHGEWKFIEPNANSMEFLQKSIDKTKQDLRELGRQPLTALSSQLTTVTTSIAAGKAKSAVTAWALALKDALENAILITMKWMNVDYDPEVNIYTGFDNVLDSSKDLEALDKARARGDISQETFLFELKRRKVLAPEFVFQDEQERLLNEIPSSMADGLDVTGITQT